MHDPHFEVFDAADGVRWRTQAANGKYDGHSDQSFADDSHARRAIRNHVHTVLAATGHSEQHIAAMVDTVRIERVPA